MHIYTNTLQADKNTVQVDTHPYKQRQTHKCLKSRHISYSHAYTCRNALKVNVQKCLIEIYIYTNTLQADMHTNKCLTKMHTYTRILYKQIHLLTNRGRHKCLKSRHTDKCFTNRATDMNVLQVDTPQKQRCTYTHTSMLYKQIHFLTGKDAQICTHRCLIRRYIYKCLIKLNPIW